MTALLQVFHSSHEEREVTRRVFLGCIVCLFHWALILASCVAVSAGEISDRQVLILNSYHPGFPWSDDEMAGLIAEVRRDHPSVEPFIEYLDEKHFPGKDHAVLMKDHLRAKYRCKKIELLVVLDNPALGLALQYRDEIFPQVPIVFAGINDFNPEMLVGHNRVTGVAENPDITGTMELVLGLHPKTREILVIHDYTATGMTVRSQFEKILPTFSGRVTVRYTPEFTFDELLQRVRSLPPDTPALIMALNTDKTGRSLSAADAVSLITSHSAAPMYAMHEIRLGHGIVGGMLLNGKDHGRLAGKIAARVLAGEDASSIPVHMESTSRPMFDFQQLERFEIPIHSLPGGNTVINMPESFYFRHRSLVLGTLSVMAVLSITLIVLSLDIVRRKRVEEALRCSEEKFSKAFLHAPLLMTLSRVEDGSYIEVNQKFEEVSGFSRQEAVGKTSIELGWISAEDRHRLIEELKARGCVEEMELTLLTRDRQEVHCIYSGQLIATEEGQCLLSIAVDISLRKLAEEARRESEMRARTILETATDGFWIVDRDGAILEVNDSYCAMIGYSRDELLTMAIEHVEAVESPAEVAARIHKILKWERASFESVHRRKDGSLMSVEISAQAQAGSEGKIFAFIHDITERKRAEEEHRKLQDQLNQAQKMESVGRLAGGVAHDFNNMLSIIIGHADIALEKLDPTQPLFANLLEIQKAAQRSADLTRQLLAFARKQTIAPKVLNVNETIEGMLKMLRRLIGEEVHLAWLPGKNLWPIKMDPSQIDQILANLCVNARDAITGVGKVTIETGTAEFDNAYCADHVGFIPGNFVLIAVGDDGCGMSKATLDRLFEPFFTTKEVGRGTGLGLATVYGIVKQNNGFISVYSQPGQGTTFRIYLPRHKGNADLIHQEDSEEPAARGHETILLVEDEPMILDMTRAMLERQGYTVLTASTPGEASLLAESHPGVIHLLVTDVIMPEKNGRELAKELLRLYPDMKGLFMSGYPANVIALHGVLDEGVHFIQKPFSKKELAAKVRKALNE